MSSKVELNTKNASGTVYVNRFCTKEEKKEREKESMKGSKRYSFFVLHFFDLFMTKCVAHSR